MPENWEMDLGYPGLGLEQLSLYQLAVMNDRLYGYCIYPHDLLERQRYQLCWSFYRQLQLDPDAPDPDIYGDLPLTPENRLAYLAEEKAFFTRHGGMDAFIDARGCDYYVDRQGDMLVVAHAMMLMAMWLGQIKNTPNATLGLTKVAELAHADYLRRKNLRPVTEEASKEKGSMFYPDLGQVFRDGITNSKYSERAWAFYQPVLPLLISTFAVMASRHYAKQNLTLNVLAVDPKGFIGSVLAYERFLHEMTTHRGRAGKGRAFVSGNFWRLPKAIIGDRKPQTLEALGPLSPETLRQLGEITGRSTLI